jgi:hypothetical protein
MNANVGLGRFTLKGIEINHLCPLRDLKLFFGKDEN